MNKIYPPKRTYLGLPLKKWPIYILLVLLNSPAFAFDKQAVTSGFVNREFLQSAPVFNPKNYSFSVSEAMAIGTTAGSVKASDPDGGALTFIITAGNTNGAFAINATTGNIRLVKRLNYHTQSLYSLTIKATDAGGLSDVATVAIAVNAGTSEPAFTTINWGTVASQPYSVYESQGEVVGGKLYTFGGFDSQKSGWTPTSRAYVYNPATNSWTAIASMPPMNGTNYGGVTHAGFTTDGTDIYFAGGYTSNATGTGQKFGTKEVWKYIVAENRYVSLPPMPKALGSGQLEYLNGKLHHIAGFPGNPSTTIEVGDHYALDLDNLAAGWRTLTPLPNPKNHPGSAVYAGKLYFIGGQHGNDGKSVTQKDVHVYEASTNSWTKLADMPVPSGTNGRAHISSSVIVAGNRILVIGGETSHNVRTSMISAYSPATNTWKNLTPFPRTISGGVAAYIGGNIYFSGGPGSKTTYKGVKVVPPITLAPLADAFVRDGSYAGVNYGQTTSLTVKASIAGGFTRTSYLKFSLNNIGSIGSAKLRIYGNNMENTSTVTIAAYGIENDSWTETGITWNNSPTTAGTSLGSVGVSGQAQYYELDVTPFVQAQLAGDKIVSFLIKDPANQNRHLNFNSKENTANPPQLVLQTATASTNNTSGQLNPLSSIAGPVNQTIIYPNPTLQRQFTVSLAEQHQAVVSLQLVDQQGNVYEISRAGWEQQGAVIAVNLARLSPKAGIYVLRVNSTSGSEAIKIMVE